MALENSEKAGKAIDNNQKEWGFFSTTIGKIVLFGGNVFANIAGETNEALKDLVVLDGAVGDINTYRNSWRSNY